MGTIIRAAVFNRVNQPLSVEEIELDSPDPNEVLIRVTASGLCHTDLHIIEGKRAEGAPAVLGHEASGEVIEVGDRVALVEPGDHVIACVSAYCGTCEYCLAGFPSICENQAATRRAPSDPPRLSRGGKPLGQAYGLAAFADHMLVSERAVVQIDPTMPLDRAALIGCGVTTGTGAVFRTARVRPGETIAVIGCGSIGLNAVQAGRIAGAGQIIAVDLNNDRLELASRMGATSVINAESRDAVAEVLAATGGRGVHYAFEAVGSPTLATQAFQMVRRGGTAILIGVYPDGANIEFPAGPFLEERKVIGCDLGSNRFPTDMPRLVQMYTDGRLDLDSLLTRRIGLDEINDGFDAMRASDGIRTIIEFA